MSADLFAEFGPPPPRNGSSTTNQPSSPSQPRRTNTDLGSALNLVSVAQSPATAFAQQPWLQPNSQTTLSFFGGTTSPSSKSATVADGRGGQGGGSDDQEPLCLGLGQAAGRQDAAALSALCASPEYLGGDDDLWGDFETAMPETFAIPQTLPPPPSQPLETQAAPPKVLPPTRSSAYPSGYTDEPVRNRVIRADTLDLMTNNFHHQLQQEDIASKASSGPSPPLRQPPPPLAKPAPKPAAPESTGAPKAHRARDSNVLFDAEDYDAYELNDDEEDSDDEDNGFGAFEGVPAPRPASKPPLGIAKQQSTTSTTVDLLSLLDLDDPPLIATAARSPQPFPAPSITSFLSSPAPSSSEPLPSPGFTDWVRLNFGASRADSVTGSAPTLVSSATSVISTTRLKVVTPEPSPERTTPTTNPTSNATPYTAWPSGLVSALPADKWSPFQDSPGINGGASTKSTTNPQTTSSTSGWEWEDESPAALETTTAPVAASPIPLHDDFDPTEPPPTNVPPPSVILTVLPEILLQAASNLFAPLAKHAANPALRERILSDPKTLGFLSAHLAVATVAARVLAGRRLRWHRDRFLLQSMSISSAGSGPSRGMKIASVDRTQTVREDREAADLVAAWRRDVGRLRSAVAAANAAAGATTTTTRSGSGNALRVPEIADAMVVQTARGTPTSPKPCVICGLRRDERVARVDVDVEDSFGEWWIEHWGHRTCRNFWKQHEQAMRQR